MLAEEFVGNDLTKHNDLTFFFFFFDKIMTLLKSNKTKNKLNIMPWMTRLTYGLMDVVHKRKCPKVRKNVAALRYSQENVNKCKTLGL